MPNYKVPSSFWQQTVPALELSTAIPKYADIVIVGGGILGIATSYWLARLGLASVLLERSAIADGATGRNGGIISIGLAESYPIALSRLGRDTTAQILQLTLNNLGLVRQAITEENIACDFRESGHITLALNSKQLEGLASSVTSLQAEGINTHMIDRQTVQESIHTPLSQEIVGGKYTSQVALVHSAKFVHGLAYAAQRLGASMHTASVVKIVTDANNVQLHTTESVINAKSAIVAVNAWTRELLGNLGDFITPVRGQALAYSPIGPVFTTGISADVSDTEEYWQQTPDGTIVLGGCRSVAPGQDVNVLESVPTVEVQEALEKVFPHLFPSLNPLKVTHRWAGLMAFTPDYLPIIDTLQGLPNIWVTGGFSGHGMAYAMRIGQLLAQSVATGKHSTLLNSFSLSRSTLLQS